MTRKFVYAVLLGCMVFVLTACSSSNNADTEQGVSSGGASFDDSDATMFFYNWYGVAADEGYYFLSDNCYLKYYDIATGTSAYLCSKAGCEHDDTECDAFISYDMGPVLLYHGGYVYGMLFEDEVDAYLWRMSADGSTKELEYKKLYTSPADEYGDAIIYDPEICICDGDIYYYTRSEAEPNLYKVALDSSGPGSEVVFSATGDRAELYRLKQNGDFIFFQSGNFVDDDYIDIDGGIYAYNAKTGEVTLVKKDAISDYCVQNGMLYYNMNGTIYAMSLTDGMEQKIVKADSDNPYIDVIGDVLYTWDDDDRILCAYDLEGNLIASQCAADWGVMSFYWGDDRYFMGMELSSDGATNTMALLNLSDFLAGSGEWMKI
ncbi:MAG: hypothetical protein LUI02_04320 [Clostridiales bacterium]|nr:hypothetical protein [Clostridiales bacterium]